jgi:hypothetical protein
MRDKPRRLPWRHCSTVWNGCVCARDAHNDDRHVWFNTLDGTMVDPARYPARVAAPPDEHTHYPATDVTGTVFSYTHPAPVCPYCVAAPSDGLREAARDVVFAFTVTPAAMAGVHIKALDRLAAALALAALARYRAALAATEQPEPDSGLDEFGNPAGFLAQPEDTRTTDPNKLRHCAGCYGQVDVGHLSGRGDPCPGLTPEATAPGAATPTDDRPHKVGCTVYPADHDGFCPTDDPGGEPTDAEKRAWRAGAEFAMPVAAPSDGLRAKAETLECIRQHFGATRRCDEYDDGRELCAPCYVRTALAATPTDD